MCAKINVAFFFGAGAECDFGLPNGLEYLQNTIFLNKDNINPIVNKFSKTDLKLANYLLSSDDSIYKHILGKACFHYLRNCNKPQKCVEKKCLLFLKEEDIKELGDKIDNTDYILTDKDKKEKENILNKFKEKLKNYNGKNAENCWTHSFLKKICSESLKDVNYAGILDKYFYTINNPVKYGPRKFSKLVNYYWACYFCIVQKIVENFDKKDELNKYKNSSEINYKEIVNNLQDFTKKLYGLNQESSKLKNSQIENSYYYLINQKLENQKYVNQGILTTNYFNFVEQIKVKENGKYAYLNGRLDYFEIPQLLEVRNLQKDNVPSDKLFFPFIFGQSFVKPIVHQKQIEEFAKVPAILKNADCLVILGFAINEDDNHVNSYLHDYASQKNKKIIFVSTEEGNEVLESVKTRLRLENSDNIKIVNVKKNNENYDNKETVAEIFKAIDEIKEGEK